jgi:phosphoserine phosphatase
MRRATGLAVLALAMAVEGRAESLEKLPAAGPGVVRLYLVRHGEAFSNLVRPPAGPPESLDQLTERGHAQARAAGAALAGEAVEAILTSPAHRARETAAEIAASFPSVVVTTDANLGPLKEGRAADGHHLTWDERMKEWKSGRDPKPDQGESLADLYARVAAAIKDIAETARGKGQHGVVIVAHSEVVEALLGSIKGRLPIHGTMTGVHNASITVVDAGPDGRLHVVAENRVPRH